MKTILSSAITAFIVCVAYNNPFLFKVLLWFGPLIFIVCGNWKQVKDDFENDKSEFYLNFLMWSVFGPVIALVGFIWWVIINVCDFFEMFEFQLPFKRKDG